MSQDASQTLPPAYNQTLTPADGAAFELSHVPCEQPKAYIHLLHGMAEHCQRYQHFARYLQQQGFYVLMHNHRGHGERTPLGHYSDTDGWQKVVSDIELVHQQVDSAIPLILFGHSMGSFIAQAYAMQHGKRLQGLILSGSNYQTPFMYHAGLNVARALIATRPIHHGSRTLNALTMGAFNQKFKPVATISDWLSRDPQQVQAYVDDPLCGFRCTASMWRDFFQGMISISSKQALAQIPSALPIYCFAGELDPVGQQGKGVRALVDMLEQSGHNKVELKLYQQGRHEMLNETNRDEVYQDCLNWLQSQF